MKIVFFEIPANDLDRAITFYSSLFGCTFSKSECPETGECMACLPDGSGALFTYKGFEPSPSGLLVSFQAPQTLSAMKQKCAKLGATIVIDITKIDAPGRDHFMVITDSEGNRIGLYGAK